MVKFTSGNELALFATLVPGRSTLLQMVNAKVFSVVFKPRLFFFKRFLKSLLSVLASLFMLGDMGYTDKLQKLCALRGLDQSTLANKVRLSKSSISRILSGAQEPKLRLAYDLAKALGVTLDYLVDDSAEAGPTDQLVMLTEEEMTILKIVRRLGPDVSIDRLLNVPAPPQAAEDRAAVTAVGGRSRPDSSRSGTS